jgi:hypothetical protein
MTKEKYLQTQLMVTQIGNVAHSLDLDGFIEQISKAEAALPVIDPVHVMDQAKKNLAATKLLAQALLPVKQLFDETFKPILAQAAREMMQAKKENESKILSP